MIRRVRLSALRVGAGKVIADVLGLIGEPFKGEVYQPYGLSSNPDEDGLPRSPHLEVHGDPDNHVSLPVAGSRLAESGTTEVYAGDMVIKIDTNTRLVTIAGADDLVVNGVSFLTHTHPTPSGQSGPPV